MTTRPLILATLLTAGVLAPAGNAEAEPETAKRDLVRTLAASGQFTILVNALVAADLDTTLRGEREFTLLAPTDRAFRYLPDGALEHLMKPENAGDLRAVLGLHVLQGRRTSADLAEAGKAATVEGTVHAVGSQGQRRFISIGRVLQADVACSNGLIHVVSEVLLPEDGKNEKDDARAELGKLKTFFDGAADTGPARWYAIHDTVMGGRSDGGMKRVEDSLVFSGNLSLENYGGFASVRAEVTDGSMKGTKGVVMRVRGDGRRYTFTINDRFRANGTNYQTTFQTRKGEWMDVVIPFAELRKTRMGQRIPGAAAVDPSSIRMLGVLIGDKKAGAYRLEIASIHAWSGLEECRDDKQESARQGS
ncbi:MAG: CIA30 family protein [Planctomycetota bacterium]|jgi:monofunctional biosynthetic peptidoglycan transglycosylase